MKYDMSCSKSYRDNGSSQLYRTAIYCRHLTSAGAVVCLEDKDCRYQRAMVIIMSCGRDGCGRRVGIYPSPEVFESHVDSSADRQSPKLIATLARRLKAPAFTVMQINIRWQNVPSYWG
ncbi:hypothetical protein RRG08_043337 [Elysia crispata]|uniref:Uncharacterized protein n=1 Tax=Elysia crispata TaxID=231223 RepID=A0AAE1ECZ5_9GAST|nr:hypothetical protein RRG08_043337 [Elysia crispata]